MRLRRLWPVVAALLALGIVVLRPAPDPLKGVETVAVVGPGGQEPALAAEVLEGLEIALGERRIRIVADTAEADAVITIEPKEAEIRISAQGLWARVRCLVTRDGRRSVMDLYVTVDERGITARLVGRRFWEHWL